MEARALERSRVAVNAHDGNRIAGDSLAGISQAFVQLYKDHHGKGPTKARSYATPDMLVCILEGGFSKSEQTLRNHGHSAAVERQRQALQDVLRTRFVDTVEQMTGRKVRSFLSGVDTTAETNAEIFLFEPLDGHEAASGWPS